MNNDNNKNLPKSCTLLRNYRIQSYYNRIDDNLFKKKKNERANLICPYLPSKLYLFAKKCREKIIKTGIQLVVVLTNYYIISL